jgi:hypothetical protein
MRAYTLQQRNRTPKNGTTGREVRELSKLRSDCAPSLLRSRRSMQTGIHCFQSFFQSRQFFQSSSVFYIVSFPKNAQHPGSRICKPRTLRAKILRQSTTAPMNATRINTSDSRVRQRIQNEGKLCPSVADVHGFSNCRIQGQVGVS